MRLLALVAGFLAGCVASVLGTYSRFSNVYALATIALGAAIVVQAVRLLVGRVRRRRTSGE